jgi:glyoxylase-like metal-dependent hydrolase (beta-lactamase superfamily II)
MHDSRHSGSFSRREFLHVAAASLAVPQLPDLHGETPAAQPFSPDARPRKISDNLFVLEDTCNVYLVRDGSQGLLIDFGSGMILRHLAELGISQIDWILHTHFHRDQAQGDPLAVAQRIPIAAPAHERHLFEDVERFWNNRRIFELYQVRNDFFSLTQNIPVAAALADYETFRWRGYDLFIQPTPGHTPGSVSLVGNIDGRTVVFSGDLMHSPGKVQTLYDLQYNYEEHEGVDLSIYSLDALMKFEPALLCPSHGKELLDPIPGMKELSQNLTGWFHYWHPGNSQTTIEFEPIQITPHVLAHPLAFSTFYAIISESGKAMFVDYGSASMNFFTSFRDADDTFDRLRFVEHSIEKLRSSHGLRSIDVAIPTHMHDDHLNGFPHLARRYGTRTWCFENMVEILENPRGRNLGCTLGEPIHVDRALHENETFRWEEFEFTVKHSPGHTDYQMAMFATIDNTRIAFTGDAFFAYDKSQIRHNLIYRNDVRSGDHAKSIHNIIEMEPSVIAPGHGEPYLVTQQMMRAFEQRVNQQDKFFAELIADPDSDIGLDPSWVQIYPYQAIAAPGQPAELEIRVRNHRSVPITVEIALSLPAGWRSNPSSVKMQVPPRQSSRAPIEVTVPSDWREARGRRAIAADVVADGRYLGQIAEAVVEIRQKQGHS